MTATVEGAETASLWRRLASICYDLLLVLALSMVVTFVLIMARNGTEIAAGEIWFQLVLLGCWWLYFAWSWTHGGQTVGMRAWRLTVTTESDKPVNWRQASTRFAAAWLSALVLGIGYAWSLFSRDRSTWHDRLSGTKIIYRKKSA